jgi:hypothetical protein
LHVDFLEGGYADAEGEAFEELVEGYRGDKGCC